MCDSMLKILHITNDEKFVESTIFLFEQVENINNYYLLPLDKIEDSRFLKQDKISNLKNIICVKYYTAQYFQIIESINPDFIYFHGLSIEHKFILNKIKNRYKVIWGSWGRDIFSSKPMYPFNYKKNTATLLKSSRNRRSLRDVIGQLYFYFLRERNRIPKDSIHYLKYIDVITTVVKEDYELFSERVKDVCKIKYIPFNYSGGVNNDVLSLETTSSNILIGNSANPENNHVETFEIVSAFDIGDRKVIVPLSYGGDAKYIRRIIELGKFYFKENFHPLLEFMPKDQYMETIQSVEFAFMNHSHQHAMGNIWYLLSSGKKVFMDYDNTAAKSLLRLGVTISNIHNIKEEEVFEPLNFEIKKHNREIINKEYGDEAVIQRTQNFVACLREMS